VLYLLAQHGDYRLAKKATYHGNQKSAALLGAPSGIEREVVGAFAAIEGAASQRYLLERLYHVRQTFRNTPESG